MNKITKSLAIQNFLFFSTKKQEEFLDNYLSIKGGEDSMSLPDKEVFLSMREVYGEVYGASCLEAQICTHIIGKISEGGRVDDALAPFLDRDIVMAFKATIEVGKTEYGIRQVIKNINQQAELKKKFNKLVRTGFFFFTVGLIFVLGVSSLALPQMLEMINEKDLDELSTVYLHLGKFINAYGIKTGFVLLTLYVLFKYSLPNAFGVLRITLENTPLLGAFYQPYKSFVANRFFNMLTLLKSSSLSLRQSLEILDDNTTPYMAEHIERMLDMTRLGTTDLKQLDTGLLTPRLRIRLKSAGARTDGNIDDAFMAIATKASADFEKYLKQTGEQLSLWLTMLGVAMSIFSVLVIINMLLAVALSIK